MNGKMIHEDLKILLILLFGIVLGYIFASRATYPLEISQMENIRNICKDTDIFKIKINISGKIREIECKNGMTYRIDDKSFQFN